MKSQVAFRILLIEDDARLRRFLRVGLEVRGFGVLEAASGREGAARLGADSPDLVLLDLNLPDVDGLPLLSEVRLWSRTPIIVMSVRASSSDKISALDGGANDYVTKPFDMGELVARIHGVLRRRDPSDGPTPTYRSGSLEVDLVRREVKADALAVNLTRREFDVLAMLVQNADSVLTHQAILRQIWGSAHDDDIQYLRVVIGRLRSKLEPDPARPQHIVTVAGAGYRLRRLS